MDTQWTPSGCPVDAVGVMGVGGRARVNLFTAPPPHADTVCGAWKRQAVARRDCVLGGATTTLPLVVVGRWSKIEVRVEKVLTNYTQRCKIGKKQEVRRLV